MDVYGNQNELTKIILNTRLEFKIIIFGVKKQKKNIYIYLKKKTENWTHSKLENHTLTVPRGWRPSA